jgi:hypothetical protein
MPSDQLNALLDKYMATLPRYKRWVLKAALAITRPEASALFILFILLLLLGILMWLICMLAQFFGIHWIC